MCVFSKLGEPSTIGDLQVRCSFDLDPRSESLAASTLRRLSQNVMNEGFWHPDVGFGTQMWDGQKPTLQTTLFCTVCLALVLLPKHGISTCESEPRELASYAVAGGNLNISRFAQFPYPNNTQIIGN